MSPDLSENTQDIINDPEITTLQNFIHSYYESFRKDGEIPVYLSLKYKHMLRVGRNAIQIAGSVTSDQSIVRQAYICGLLHDAGRFIQLEKYGTFKDNESFDHALLSIQIIENHNLLNFLNHQDREKIRLAIQHHNKKTLPDSYGNDSLLLAKILRDADKADIYRVMSNYYDNHKLDHDKQIQLGLSDSKGYQKSHLNKLFNHQPLDLDNLRNLNELKLLQLGWIFDIHFRQTFLMIKQNQYIDKIISYLPSNNEINELKQHLKYYIEERMGNKSIITRYK